MRRHGPAKEAGVGAEPPSFQQGAGEVGRSEAPRACSRLPAVLDSCTIPTCSVTSSRATWCVARASARARGESGASATAAPALCTQSLCCMHRAGDMTLKESTEGAMAINAGGGGVEGDGRAVTNRPYTEVDNICGAWEDKLGGACGLEGMGGSITKAGIKLAFQSMSTFLHMDNSSVVFDLGGAIGRMLPFAKVAACVSSAWMAECDDSKIQKAVAFLPQVYGDLIKKGLAAPVGQLDTLMEVIHHDMTREAGGSWDRVRARLAATSHIYSFCEGIPREALAV
ncbi:hypothetical protein Agub_g13000, partial [Astrephomene gubernaculifera]